MVFREYDAEDLSEEVWTLDTRTGTGGGPKSLQVAPKNPPRRLKKLPRSFLGAKMELKEAQKSSPEASRSSKDDLKIPKRKCSPNHMKTNENL